MRFSFLRKKIALFLALSLVVTAPVFAAEDVPGDTSSSYQSYSEEDDSFDIDEYDDDTVSSDSEEEDGLTLPAENETTGDENITNDKADSGQALQSEDNENDEDDDSNSEEDKENDNDEDKEDGGEDAASVSSDDTDGEEVEEETVSDPSVPRKVTLYRRDFQLTRNGSSSNQIVVNIQTATASLEEHGVTVIWELLPDDGVTIGYRVYRSDNAEFTNPVWVGDTNKNTCEFPDNGIYQEGDVYFYRVYRLIGSSVEDPDSASRIVAAYFGERTKDLSSDPASETYVTVSMSGVTSDMPCTIDYDGQPHAATCTTPADYRGVIEYYYKKAGGEWTKTAPSEVGEYQVKLAVGNYKDYNAGSDIYTGFMELTNPSKWNFEIVSTDLSNATIEFDSDELTYNGSNQKPGVTSVKIGSRELEKDVDYEISYDPADGGKDVGDYTVTITPASSSSYTGSMNKTYSIVQCPITVTAKNETISQGAEPALAYTNNAPVTGETPAFEGKLATTYDKDNPIANTYPITQGTLALKNNGSFDKDNYSINFTPGVLTVNATMHTVHFRSNHTDATPADQEKTVEDGGTIAESSVTTPTRTGDWYFDGWYKVSACSAGNEWDFSAAINRNWDVYAKWTEKKTAGTANFIVMMPTARIYNRGTQGVTAGSFTKPADYDGTLSFSYARVTNNTPGTFNADPIDAGEYQVKITAPACSKYKAISGLTDPSWRFSIEKYTLTNANYVSTSPTSYIYNGSEQPEPTVTIKHGAASLIKDSEFTLSYPDGRTTLGKKRITVSGCGNNYYGSFTVTDAFEIGKKKLSDSDVTVTVASGSIYTGSAVEPAVTVQYNGNTLSPATDYTLSYSDNVNVSAGAKVTITARDSSNYSDSKTVTFTISPRPLTSTGIVYSVTPTTYTYDGTEHKPAVTLKDNGTDLSAADDYTVTYLNNVNAGSNTAVAKVTGKGNYTGELQETFTINRATVNETNAEIIISNYEKYDDQNVGYFEYSGTPITPGITLKINGVTVTVKDTDFDRSDSNNGVSTDHIRQGSITLTGKAGGNYNGSVSKTYNIINKKIKAVFSSLGTSSGEKYVYYKEAYGDLPSLSKTGYTFGGWWTLAAGGTEVVTTTTVTQTSDHVLYAHWDANSHNMLLKAGDGHFGSVDSDKERSIHVTYGSTYGEGTLNPSDTPLSGTLPEPVRTGYDFDGWYADASTKIEASTTVEYDEDREFTAHWEAKKYTVTFNKNTTGDATVTPATKQVTFGQEYGTLATARRTGYTCTGWYTDSVNETGTLVEDTTIVTTSAENQTLYAHWDANTYHVTLDVNGGDPVATGGFNVTFDGYYTGLSTIADPTRTGYEFTGWYDAKSGGNMITDTSPKVSVARDHTLYAQWRAKKYQVTLDLNDNGSGKASIDPATNPIEVTYDQPYSNLPAPEWLYREYTFTGWFTAGGQEIKKTDICKTPGNHQLTAHWEFTISVNGIALDRSEAEIKTREELTLTASIKPRNATDKKVIWKSSDSSVASVDKDGRVLGLKPGEVVITAASHFDPSIKAECKISVVPGNEEEVVDTEGNKVIIVRDPKTNAYTTLDGLSVLVISRADGSVPDTPQYLFTSKRIKPGHKGFVLYKGILYKSSRYCKLRYRKNKRAGTAKATVIWKKIAAPRKNGVKRSQREFIILVRSVSTCNVVKMKKWFGHKKILKMWLECDGVKIRTRKINFTAQYSEDAITIHFRNSLEGDAVVSMNNIRQKLDMMYVKER